MSKTRKLIYSFLRNAGLVFPLCGALPVFAGVNPDGSYSESLPIEIPAGRNGIQPKLALTYNSNAGSGITGVGWNLQGLPVITRMNYGRGVNYDSQDTFGGPEGRLIDVSASAGTPAGTVFHAESESWSKYEALGWDGNLLNGSNRCGDSACAWRVTDRSGISYLYGDAGASRVGAINNSGAAINGGSVRVWALTRVTDLNGNYYEVEYFQNAGQFYPKKITYTLGGWASRYYAVTFAYDQSSRPDKDISYGQSSYVQTNWRLQEVAVTYRDSCLIFFTCSDPIRSYRLTYDAGTTGRSRLVLVQQFAADGSSLISATTLSYQNGNLNGSFGSEQCIGSGVGTGAPISQNSIVGDFNGDGRTDIAAYGGGKYWCVQFGNGHSFGSEQCMNSGVGVGSPITDNSIMGDFNGDGRMDIAATAGGGTWCVQHGNGQSFGPEQCMGNGVGSGAPISQNTIVGDFNGDGRTDIAAYGGGGYWCVQHGNDHSFSVEHCINNGVGTGAPIARNTLVGDFDGDGKTDIAATAGNGYWCVQHGNSYSFGGEQCISNGVGTGAPIVENTRVGDFDGDGRTDIAAYGGGGYWCVQHGNSYSFGSEQCLSAGVGTSAPISQNTLLGDFDGDGRMDIAATAGGGYWCVQHGNGHSFGSEQCINNGVGTGAPIASSTQVGDFNGDGRTDIAAYGGGGYWCVQHGSSYSFDGEQCLNSGVGADSPISNNTLQGDFNGDGRSDVTATGGGGYWCVQHGSGNNTFDRLTNINSSSGSSAIISYEWTANLPNTVIANSSNYPDIANKGNRQVVTQITTMSDRDLDNDSQHLLDSFVTRYEYENGRVSTGTTSERASLGFEKVKTIDVNSGDYKIDTYHQTKPFHTMLKETRNYLADGTPLSAQISATPELWLCDESGCTVDPTNNPNPTQPKQLRQSGEIIAKQYIKGIEALVERQSIVSVDAYGNPLESKKVKQLGSEVYTEHVYATYINALGNVANTVRAIGLPVMTKKCVEDCSLFNTTEEKENLYDNLPSGEAGLQHLITSTKTKIGGTNFSRNLSYYPNGNLHIETNDTQVVKTLTYDPDYQQYIRETRLTVPGKPDQVNLQYVDARYGVVTESVDLNGTKTQTEIDDQGRIIGKRIKNASDMLLSRSSYEYHLTGNANPADHFAVECVHRKDSPGDNIFNLKDCKYTYLDSMDRKYLTISPAVNGQVAGFTAIHTKYDEKNRVTHVSEPYFKSDTTSSIGTPDFYSQTIYDAYGRAWQQIAPDNKVTETNVYYSTGSTFVRTEVIGAGTIKESTTDARGLTRSITEAKGTPIESTITNTYYANGLLWQVSVPQGLTIIDYYQDTKKQKSIIDPNAGRTDYTYITNVQSPAYGKVLVETRPAPNGSGNITVTHEYNDSYGRLTRTIFSSGEEQLLIYDETDVQYGRNLLTTDEFKSQGYSYKRRHSYNELGQELQTTTDIRHTSEILCPDVGAIPCHTRVENVFDELGRKKKIVYPDEKETVISYFGGSPNVSSIAHNGIAYANYDGYNNRAQPTGIHHGNGTRTEFTYVPETGMMDSLKTFDVQNRAVQDLAYTFNDRNNIEDLTDNIITGGSYHYEYDALNRVKQATRTDGKIFSYAFDEKGNLTLKENRTQVYGAGTTKLQYSDLATQAGTIRTNFNWSAAGNLMQRATSSEAINYTWSGENFLIESTRVGGNFNGTKMRNVYAGESNRFLRIYEQPGKQKVKTWNLGGIEFRETWSGDKRDDIQVTKYIYGIDGGRIASVTGNPGELVISATSNSQFRMAKFYSGQSVSGIIAKAPHLFMGCYYFASETYSRHRYVILFSLLIFTILLLVQLNRERSAGFTFRDFSRRLFAFITIGSFALANCTSGKNDPIFSNQSYSAALGKIGDLYKGLPAGTVYYHGNHLGSSTLISDKNGMEKIRVHYTAYGEIDQNLSGRWDHNTSTLVHDPDQSKDAYLSVAYTGQSYSIEEEMYFYGARHYDPTTGIFISADTIVPDAGTPMGYNRYMYVRGNPIKYTDPTGHSWWDDFTDWVDKAWEDVKAWVDKNSKAIAAIAIAVVVSVITVGMATAALAAAYGAAFASSFWGVVAIGAIAGAAGGFAGGASGAWLNGASFVEGLGAGFKGAVIGAVTGAIMAGVGYGANKLFNKLFSGNGAEKAAQSADKLDEAASKADDGNYAGDGCDDCTARDAGSDDTLMAKNDGGGTRPEPQQPTTRLASDRTVDKLTRISSRKVTEYGEFLQEKLGKISNVSETHTENIQKWIEFANTKSKSLTVGNLDRIYKGMQQIRKVYGVSLEGTEFGCYSCRWKFQAGFE